MIKIFHNASPVKIHHALMYQSEQKVTFTVILNEHREVKNLLLRHFVVGESDGYEVNQELEQILVHCVVTRAAGSE